ncbi:hypothetical protein GCM10008967_08860 [Bacillus carboniphilus]|uniref:N-acetyltransferase domain-containing protein n=1 Tax=Bacillus carboniphilus TaxID=86663 RepID=A0ABN0VYF8_9BACI
MNITIRKFTDNDVNFLVYLHNQSTRLEKRNNYKTLMQFNEFLDEPGEEIRANTFVAEVNSQIVGYNALCLVKGEEHINVYSYGTVEPGHRRIGVGTELLKHSLKHLEQMANYLNKRIIFNLMVRLESPGQNELAQKLMLNKHTDLLSMKLELNQYQVQDPPDMEYRFSLPSKVDANTWAHIYNDAFSWSKNINQLTKESVLYEFNSSEFSPDLYILVRDEHNTPVGFVAAHEEDEAKCVISTLALLSEHQGKGVGKSLLIEVLNRMKLKDFKEVRLTVDYQNPTAAIPLYKRIGFMEKTRIIHFTYDMYPKK